MSETTDIPEYGQFLKSQAPAPKDEDLGDILDGVKMALARQMRAQAESLGAPPDQDHAAQIERVEEDMRRVHAEFADPCNAAANARMVCELLLLPRVCAFARCRKSDCCRGGRRCLRAAGVPEAVFAGAVGVMFAARLPWIASGRAKERIAYEAWVAAMEARASSERVTRSARPREPRTGFPLSRE
jgi:hypothetical protein